MKSLLTVSAALETMAGLGLMVSPSAAAVLFGASLDTAFGSVVARIAGAALLALAVSCWVARSDDRSRAARGVAGGMLAYNAAVAALLVDARFRTGLAGVALWPGVAIHTAMTVWCVVCLLRKASQTAGTAQHSQRGLASSAS